MKMMPTQDKRSVPLIMRRGILLKIRNMNSVSPYQKGPPQGKSVYVVYAQFETKGYISKGKGYHITTDLPIMV